MQTPKGAVLQDSLFIVLIYAVTEKSFWFWLNFLFLSKCFTYSYIWGLGLPAAVNLSVHFKGNFLRSKSDQLQVQQDSAMAPPCGHEWVVPFRRSKPQKFLLFYFDLRAHSSVIHSPRNTIQTLTWSQKGQDSSSAPSKPWITICPRRGHMFKAWNFPPDPFNVGVYGCSWSGDHVT